MKTMNGLKAKNVMSSPVITLDVETTLRDAAGILKEQEISGALVTDTGGRPTGVVSLFDIASYLTGLERSPNNLGGFYAYNFPRLEEGGEGWEKGFDEVEKAPFEEATIREIMTPEIIAVDPDASLEDVATTMLNRHIHRVFVGGKKNKPEGVITTMDVLAALAGKRA